MGNCILRAICGKISDYKTDSGADQQSAGGRISATAVGVSALAADLLHYDITNQVPEGLSQHVTAAKKAQVNWYRKLLEAWREAKPPPKTSEEASKLIVDALKRHQKAHVEGLLNYYGLPLAQTGSECETHPHTASTTKLKPDGVKYELNTLPVDIKCIPDGDTITVYVDATVPHESCKVPPEIKRASKEYTKATTAKNFQRVNNLRKTITDAGYRMVASQNGIEILAKKYRIRFRYISSSSFFKEKFM